MSTGEKKDLEDPVGPIGGTHITTRDYFGEGTHYITSGGGGAFLHGTLELKPQIEAKWLRDDQATLELEACYPSKEESKKLLDANKRFGALDPQLTWSLAILYLVYSFALTSRSHWDVALIEYVLLAASLWAYSRYQEGYSSAKIVGVAGAQASPTCWSLVLSRFSHCGLATTS